MEPVKTAPTLGLQHPSALRTAAMRPVWYVAIVLISMLCAYIYKLETDSVFACPASGYGQGSYLAYCQTGGYGDYDHGAFWFGLEPDARQAASNADVLFLGNSRMQFAFSTEATHRWFESAAAPFYLLGFSYGENTGFEAPLLDRLKPRAHAYVINVDRFFDTERVTSPTDAIQHHADEAQANYEEKRVWQTLHRHLCTTLPVCGHQVAFFRSRADGTWSLQGSEAFKAAPVGDEAPEPSDVAHWASYAALGERFVSHLPVDRRCVVLTIAPWEATRLPEARAIASALHLELVVPQVDGLRTLDGDHLDRASAEKWSAAFFDAAGPRLRQCLQHGQPAHS